HWQLRTASGGGGTLVQSNSTGGSTAPVTSDAFALRYFRVQPFDKTGNAGNWSADRAITFATLDTPGITPKAVLNPVVVANGALGYENTTSAYTTVVTFPSLTTIGKPVQIIASGN